MRRFFLSNILFVLAVNVLIKPIWIFFIDRTVQNRLGAETYGSYQAMMNLAIIFQIIMDFGLTSYNSRMVSQDKSKVAQLFPSFFWARIILTTVYVAIMFVVGISLGYNRHEMILLGGVLTIQALSSMVLFLRSSIAGMHRFKADSVFSVLDKILVIIICGALLLVPSWAANFQLEWFIAAQQFSYAITAIIAFFVLTYYAGVRLSIRFDKQMVGQVIKTSVPYALLIFLMGIYIRSDMILLERLLPEGKHEAGIYVAGFRLLDAANIFGLSLAGMLLPLFGSLLSNGQSVKPIVKLSGNMIIPIAIAVAAIGMAFGQEIIEALMHDTKPYSGKVLGILMFSYPAWSIMYIYSTLLTANGSLKLLIQFSLMAILINLSLNFLLIPSQGAVGAAIAGAATQWFIAIACIIACMRLFKIVFSLKIALRYLLYLFMIGLAYFLIHQEQWTWMQQTIALAMAAMLAYFSLGFFSWKAILGFIKQKINPS